MSAFANAVFAFLLAALWQSTAIVAMVWLVFACLPRANATTRYAVWLAALVISILLPALTARVSATSAPIAPPAASQAFVVPSEPNATAAGAVSPSQPPAFGMPALHLNVFPAIAKAVAFVWIGVVAFLLIRLVASLMYLERLKRDSLPVDPDVRAGLRRWNAVGKGNRDVRLCVSEAIGVPVAIGLFDSMILLPSDYLALDPNELDCVLLHELAHLRRRDDWTNALQRVASALLFFSPAVAFACSRLDVEREVACDDSVLRFESDPLIYANCLARIARLAAWPRSDVAAPGIFTTRRGTSVRIERLLDGTRDARVRVSLVPLAAASLVLCLVLAVAAFAEPALTFASPIGKAAMDSTTPPATSRIAYAGDWDIKAWERARPTAEDLSSRTFSWAPVPPDIAPSERGVNLSLHYKVSSSNNSVRTSLADLGIGAASLQGAEHPVHFTARFSAGTFVCDGVAAGGLAKGTFSFTPDQTYMQTLASLRGTALTPRDEVLSGLFDLQLPYIEALAEAGLRDLSFQDLIALKMFGATPEYVKSVRDDFPSADVKMIAGLRMFKGSSADIHELHVSFPTQNLDMIVALISAGVTPAYVASLQRAGVRELTADNVAALKTSGVTAAFADHLAAEGPHGLMVDEVVHLAKQSSPPANP